MAKALETRWAYFLGISGFLGLSLWVLFSAPAGGQEQEILRHSLVVPGDAKTIFLYADDIATWNEAGQQVFFLNGQVWIQQGVNHVRLGQGVVWVDLDSRKTQGIYKLDLYGEGNVVLEEGPKQRTADKAFLEMATRGEIRIRTFKSKTELKNRSADPVYRRARMERLKWRRPQPSASNSLPNMNSALPPTIQEEIKPKFPPNVVIPAPYSAEKDFQKEIQQTSAQETQGPDSVSPFPPQENAPPPLGLPSFSPPYPEKGKKTAEPGNSEPGKAGLFPGDEKESGKSGVPLMPPPDSDRETHKVEIQPPMPLPESNPGSGLPPYIPPPRPTSPSRPFSTEGLTIRPRFSATEQQLRNFTLPTGETAYVFTGGVILTVGKPGDKKGFLDIEADRVVLWKKGEKTPRSLDNLGVPQGGSDRDIEFYLSGNVEIRNQTPKEIQILRADEIYYDLGRNVALALKGDLEIRDPKLLYPLHFKAAELQQLNAKLFKGLNTDVFASALPSDPGLRIQVREATLEERNIIRRTIFGLPFTNLQTGQPIEDNQRFFKGKNMILRLEDVPIFYFPYVQGDAEDPLGPLENLGVSYNQIFGLQLYTTFNMYDLIGITPVPGTRWRVFIDELTRRGPALGTTYDFASKDFFGLPASVQGQIKAYGIWDRGQDILGGDRGRFVFYDPTTFVPIIHPELRGRFLGRLNVQDLPQGFSTQAQVSAISDKNFLEQFFMPEWLTDLNQETFVYLKQQQDNWAWTALVEPRIRNWITETQWLPRADGYLLGQKFFDMFTYNLHASAGYAQLLPSHQPPFAFFPTDMETHTGRFDLFNEISMPVGLGPVKVVPYLVGDLAYYTQDLSGDDRGRAYGGAGLRASMPLSKYYPGIVSDLFNVDGVFHKIVLSGNYYLAGSTTSLNRLPQLDRFNDDASDQALRDIHARQALFYPASTVAFLNTPLFNPQIYALRRLIDNHVDTLDDIQVLQTNIRQRWQTKRGFPGKEHIIDWMVLDVGFSVFPQSHRDNFGNLIGIIEYDWLWNIGDRTALVSSGWFEPEEDGPHVFNIGAFLNRPDRTSLYLGYRLIDPLESRAVVGSLTYAFSAKYALTASTIYDFGVHNQVNSLVLTRIGSDLQVSLGINYNSILKNFGVTFEIVPNLLPVNRRLGPGAGGFGTAMAGR